MAIAHVLDYALSLDSFVVAGNVMSSARPRGAPTLPCQISISVEEFLSVLRAPYAEMIKDLRDDPIESDADPIELASYPPLREMLDEEPLLFNAFERLSVEFFAHFLGGPNGTSNVRYFIDRFVRLRTDAGVIHIDAECLPY